MISFKIAGFGISFDFSFFAIVALFCLLDAPELALTALCACAIHELGHCMAALISDIKIQRIIFWAGGVKMVSGSTLKSLHSEIFVLAAGPLANFMVALLYCLTGESSAFSVNLILGLFNLLPFTNLDGGAVTEKIFEHFGMDISLCMKITAVISATAIMSFFLVFHTGNITAFITLILLVIYEFIY